MAKPLSPKSQLIREAIAAHPNKKPKGLADLINSSEARKEDKIKVTPGDVTNQKQALKGMAETAAKQAAVPAAAAPAPEPVAAEPAAKPQLNRNGTPRKKPGRKPGYKKAAAAPVAAPAKKTASAVDVVESVFGLAEQVGGIAQLKKLVDRLAAR
jgi:hypothetical protein